jgi:hypothetical protein
MVVDDTTGARSAPLGGASQLIIDAHNRVQG